MRHLRTTGPRRVEGASASPFAPETAVLFVSNGPCSFYGSFYVSIAAAAAATDSDVMM